MVDIAFVFNIIDKSALRAITSKENKDKMINIYKKIQNGEPMDENQYLFTMIEIGNLLMDDHSSISLDYFTNTQNTIYNGVLFNYFNEDEPVVRVIHSIWNDVVKDDTVIKINKIPV